MGLRKAEVQTLYLEGVEAVRAIASSFETQDWEAPACGTWSRSDTVRHLIGVADWYHDWLDRALDGDSTPPFPESEFDERNAAALTNLQELDGPSAVSRFNDSASHYLERASQSWDVPYGFPAGTVTVGLHVAVAAAEWHLHAWDLTAGQPERHRPEAPAELFKAVGAAMAQAQGGFRGRLLRFAVPLAAKRSPWRTILDQAGR